MVRVHVGGQAGDDVAAQLGVPRGTVESRIHRGGRALLAGSARLGIGGSAA
ncbi:hypothetical protein [Streptomyces hokutonensis]|uniref:hypothetical protein n=1 Tax=Streptomyces hokutonensis TaxID=1306990 RepID=UPI0036AB93F7